VCGAHRAAATVRSPCSPNMTSRARPSQDPACRSANPGQPGPARTASPASTHARSAPVSRIPGVSSSMACPCSRWMPPRQEHRPADRAPALRERARGCLRCGPLRLRMTREPASRSLNTPVAAISPGTPLACRSPSCFSRLHTAGARLAGRPALSRPSSRFAIRPGQVLCPGRCRGTAACPGREPPGR
jgi:hypothetical protein